MTPASPDTPPTPLAAALVLDAVQRLEADGPLDDAAALRQAFHARPTRAGQVAERAWLLGRRLGLPHELARWRHLAGWAVLALACAMALAALATARAVLAPGGGINAVAAFVSLLGGHALMLLVWLAGLLWAGQGSALLGRAALGLAARVPIDRGPHALLLLRSAAAVLRRARLWPWLTGLLSHGIWALDFVLMLAVLAFGFAFHAYRLTWESTILGPGFFQRFVAATGALPALLGFPVPDAAAVAQVGNAGAAAASAASAEQRDWAWWLMGCVAVYGLLPRLLLAAFSAWRWRAGQARLAQVDMADPYVRRLIARLDALEPPPQVIDAEQRPDALPTWAPSATPGAPGTWALIGFELPPELPWPPAGLPAPSVPALAIAGGARERQDALARLAAARPAALLLACHATASPDRGTARFLREAAALAGRTALLLAAAGPVPEAAARRWRTWLDSEGFGALALMEQAPAAMDWIAND